MTWIAITAEHHKLRSVRKRFRKRGYQAYVAAVATRKLVAKGGAAKRRRSINILMPYVLVEAPTLQEPFFSLWLHEVKETRDVRGVVGSLKTGPHLVPDDAILKVKDGVKRFRFELEASRAKRKLSVGQKARHKTGHTGRVDWIKGAKIGLETTLFGSARVVEVFAKDLEAA